MVVILTGTILFKFGKMCKTQEPNHLSNHKSSFIFCSSSVKRKVNVSEKQNGFFRTFFLFFLIIVTQKINQQKESNFQLLKRLYDVKTKALEVKVGHYLLFMFSPPKIS